VQFALAGVLAHKLSCAPLWPMCPSVSLTPCDIDREPCRTPIITRHGRRRGQKGRRKVRVHFRRVEFTSEGEALGYISLDQARVLAMRTARESPGDYGRRYRNVSMAFEVIEDTETEDHYVITLSLRPQGEFTGTQGHEQFFIEKEGRVAVRQVLAQPKLARRFPVIPVAIAMAVVGVVAVNVTGS